jgi:hypothetical protein
MAVTVDGHGCAGPQRRGAVSAEQLEAVSADGHRGACARMASHGWQRALVRVPCRALRGSSVAPVVEGCIRGKCVSGSHLCCAGTLVTVHDMPTLTVAT